MKRIVAAFTSVAVCFVANILLAQEEELAPTYKHMKELEYFVGEWEFNGPLVTGDEKQELSLITSYRWIKNKAFLLVTMEDSKTKEITYVATIGWDPDEKRIMSWDFNLEGTIFSYAQGKTDDGWAVKGTGRRADGGSIEFSGKFIYQGDKAMKYKGAGTITKDGEKLPVTLEMTAKKIKD